MNGSSLALVQWLTFILGIVSVLGGYALYRALVLDISLGRAEERVGQLEERLSALEMGSLHHVGRPNAPNARERHESRLTLARSLLEFTAKLQASTPEHLPCSTQAP